MDTRTELLEIFWRARGQEILDTGGSRSLVDDYELADYALTEVYFGEQVPQRFVDWAHAIMAQERAKPDYGQYVRTIGQCLSDDLAGVRPSSIS